MLPVIRLFLASFAAVAATLVLAAVISTAGFAQPAGYAGAEQCSANSPLRPAPTFLLAERYRDDIDVSRYWVSEKLDGARAIWDGKTLRFRSGNPVPAPKWFLDALPGQPLDGELWLGRGSFDQLSAIVRRQAPDDAEWRRVRYMIFELPDAPAALASASQGSRLLLPPPTCPGCRPFHNFSWPIEQRCRKCCATSSARAAKD